MGGAEGCSRDQGLGRVPTLKPALRSALRDEKDAGESCEKFGMVLWTGGRGILGEGRRGFGVVVSWVVVHK